MGNALLDRVIKRFTNGPFAHTEIDLGNGLYVGSHATGVYTRTSVPADRIIRPTSVFDSAGIAVGMAWIQRALDDSKDHHYGWLDIVSDVLALIRLPFFVGSVGNWDCSDFVTRYLVHAGADQPLGKLADTPELVSPNDLAKAYANYILDNE